MLHTHATVTPSYWNILSFKKPVGFPCGHTVGSGPLKCTLFYYLGWPNKLMTKVPLNSLQWDFLLVIIIKSGLPRNGLIKSPELLRCIVLRKKYRLWSSADWDKIPSLAACWPCDLRSLGCTMGSGPSGRGTGLPPWEGLHKIGGQ